MNDTVFLKKRRDLLWGEHPYIMVGITCVIGTVLMFAVFFVCAYNRIFIPITSFTLLCIALMAEFILSNIRRHYYTGSMGFVIKDSTLYAVRLLYTNKPLGKEVDGPFIYTPSGSAAELVTLSHNIKVANDVQTHEREVMYRAKFEKSYINALNEIFNSLDKYPYVAKPDEAETRKVFRFYRQKMQNTKLVTQNTKWDSYKFLIMEKPEIIKLTKSKFVVRYVEKTGEEGIATFSNCFDGLVEAINNLNGANH